MIQPLDSPKINTSSVRGNLVEDQKDWAPAGNARGDRWSPFQKTCRAIAEYVASHPGATLTDVLAAVPTHYKRSSIAQRALPIYLKKGVVKGVRGQLKGKIWYLYPANTAEPTTAITTRLKATQRQKRRS